jgi:aspartate/methionine/tyrosine aminotransferase
MESNRFSAALERAKTARKELLDLTESNPTHCGFAYDPALLATLRNPRGLTYDPHPKGLLRAREAVCEYYQQRRAEVDPEQIILTASTSESYSFIFRLLCNPGDEVLVPAPSYPLFEFLASIQDVKLVSYQLIYDHGWQLDFHSLEENLTPRTRAMLVVHPNNPTGSFVKPSEMEALDELCCKRHLAIVADEVFLDYAHDGVDRESSAGAHQALTFTLSGISKICALPQMKLAWIVPSGPAELTRQALARLELIADTYLSVSTPVQLALPEFLARRNPIQRQIQERVAANLAELDHQLANHKSVRRLEVEGAWYAVLRVPATRSDEDLAIELLEQHSLVVHPGLFYDFPGEGYLVVSLITATETFGKALKRVVNYSL